MIYIYSSWTKGLDTDREALKLIKDSVIISGIEVWGSDLADNIRKNGLKVSLHNPINALKLDLVDKKMIPELEKNENLFIIKEMRESDSPVIGFHLYFKPNPIMYYLVHRHPLKREDILVLDDSDIKEHVIKNLSFLHDTINSGSSKKKVSFETYPYSEAERINRFDQELFPEFQKILDVGNKLSSVEFISGLLEEKELKKRGIGFLFDIVHVLIAADTRAERKEIDESAEGYIDRIIHATAGRVHQLHINAPKMIGKGLGDLHAEIVKGEALSEQVLRIGRKVLKHNPKLSVITLEIDTDLGPKEHAKKLIEQARLIQKELKLS